MPQSAAASKGWVRAGGWRIGTPADWRKSGARRWVRAGGWRIGTLLAGPVQAPEGGLTGTLRPAGRYILAEEEHPTKMKRLVCVFLTAAALVTGGLIAQDRPWSRRASTVSPEANAKEVFGGRTVSVNYSAPSLRDPKKLNDPSGQAAPDRALFDIMKNDRTMPVWRAGAQDATLLHSDADLTLGGIEVPKGEYTLFVSLEDKAKWQLVVNKQTHQWGLSYDKSQDLARIPMTMGKPPAKVETLKWSVTGSGGNKGVIQLEWENYSASVPFTVK